MLAPWPDDIGRLARQQRIDLGLSQDELAERAGVTRQWLSRFEQAKADVSLTKALQVLRELGLVVDVTPRAATKARAGVVRVPRVSFDIPTLSPETIARMNEAVKASAAATASLPADLRAAVRRMNDAGVLPSRTHAVEKPQEKER